MGALSGVTVLDLGTYIAGPYCATVLGEFGADPAAIKWLGPAPGEHTDEVLGELLGLGPGEMADLREEGVV